MGCWNETCGISQLPIQYNDDVRLFILSKTKERSYKKGNGGYCYSNDCWEPYGVSLCGKYNDYGSIQDVKVDYATKLLLNKLKGDVTKINGNNIDDPNLSWEDIVSAIQQEDVEGKDNLGIMFVHENIFQSLVSMDRINENHDDIGYLYVPSSELFDIHMEKFFNDIEDSVKTQKELREKFKNSPEEKSSALLDLKLEMLKLIDSPNSIVSSMITDYRSKEFFFYNDALRDLTIQGCNYKDENVKLICFKLKEHFMFENSLISLRKGWMPQFGKGSQDADYEAHIRLSNAIKEFSDKKIQELKDDGCKSSEYSLSEYEIQHNNEEMRKRKILAFA